MYAVLVTEATVCGLWRYPVKSMRGEQLAVAAIDARGIVGDRAYAVRTPDGKLGSGKTTSRFARIDGLLECAARLDDGSAAIELPGGATVRADDPGAGQALGSVLGMPVSLAREDGVSHFDAAAIHLVTTSSLHWLRNAVPEVVTDERRLRPNLVLDTGDLPPHVEDAWLGRTLAVGNVCLRIRKRTERCVMVNAAQADLAASPAVLRAITQGNAACIGVYADTVTPGTIHVGDPARISRG